MSLPTINDIQAVDPVLTNMLVGYRNADSRFVAGRVFPSIPVDKQTSTYYVLTKSYWFLNNVERRAAGAQFGRAGYGVSTSTVTAEIYGLEHVIPDEIAANNQVPMGLENLGTQWLAHQSLINKERRWATNFMKTSFWGTDVSGATATKWSNYTDSDPVDMVRTGKRTISQATGMVPNYMVMGEIVMDHLANHPDLMDRVKYVTTVTATAIESAIASILGVGTILVGQAIYNSANEAQTASYSPIIDDDALLLYVSPTPGIMSASAGYTFEWTGGGGGGSITTYRDQSIKANVLQMSEAWEQAAVATDLGYFFSDIVD